MQIQNKTNNNKNVLDSWQSGPIHSIFFHFNKFMFGNPQSKSMTKLQINILFQKEK